MVVVVVIQVHVNAASVPTARVPLGLLRQRNIVPPSQVVGETDEIVLSLFGGEPCERHVGPRGVVRRLVRRLLVDRRQLPLGNRLHSVLVRLGCRPRVTLPVRRARVVPTLCSTIICLGVPKTRYSSLILWLMFSGRQLREVL